MYWGKILLAAALSISVILTIALITVYLELIGIQEELLKVQERLAAVKAEVDSVERTLTSSSFLVSVDVLVVCGSESIKCEKVYTYAGAPVLLALSNCTTVEVKSSGSSLRVARVPAFTIEGIWELAVCTNNECAPSDLMQSLWGGEKVILTCTRGQP